MGNEIEKNYLMAVLQLLGFFAFLFLLISFQI